MTTIKRIIVFALVLLGAGQLRVNAQFLPLENLDWSPNDFEIFALTIPQEEIFEAGPPRDGIPSIDAPKFVSSNETTILEDDDYVIGVNINGVVKAYPIRILSYHEVVNDQFGEESIAITYNPLCASVLVFSSDVEGEVRSFGLSGLVHNSSSLLYDRETESLWSQVKGESIAGEYSGITLDLKAHRYTTWGDWKANNPETLVLSEDTGFCRDYKNVPYEAYANSSRLMFPVNQSDDTLPLKEKVIGVEINGNYKAYPFTMLSASKDGIIEDELDYINLKIFYNKDTKSAYVTDISGNELPIATMYWFSWFASHPETEIYPYTPGNVLPTMAVIE